jgi:Uri superfamily endonuclease
VPAAFYVYLGSALSSGGVTARVSRHLDGLKAAPKNVDFLKPFALPTEVWWTPDEDHRECPWSATLAASPEYY